jgi:hypothetical protein
MGVGIDRGVPERGRVDAAAFAKEVASGYAPVVLRGQAAHWPAVQAARRSDSEVARYLAACDTGRETELLVGPPEIAGRFFYDAGLSGCNFQKRSTTVNGLLAHLLRARDEPRPSALYAGAAATDDHLTGWTERNPLGLDLPNARARLWIGNESRVATHFDEASNIAIVVAGQRRFTLFPPEQVDNLYVGPLHLTIAGPPVSMVDVDHPDLVRYPRYATARRHGLVADLEPGDAIYIPPIWWHAVHARGAFNVMVNHWWEEPGSRSPLAALIETVRAVRDLPAPHRHAWRHWFERYAFDDDAPHAADHLPEHARGVAGPPSERRTAFLRALDDPSPPR